MTTMNEIPRDPSTHVYERPPNEPVSRGITAAMSRFTGRSPLDLEPLAEAVDPDAIDAVVDRPAGGDAAVTVSFDYAGLEVTVTPTEIRLRRPQ